LSTSEGTIDVLGGTNRSKNAIDLFKINGENGSLEFILDQNEPSEVDEVYGFCFYHSPISGKNYAILCGKDGQIEQYEIKEGSEKLSLNLVNSFEIESQPEGLVADHKNGFLYIGEENNCIWRVNAEPGNHELVKLSMSSEEDNVNIKYDIEGLAIYYTSSDHGYLIASSQGNNSFAIYDRFFDNQYLGSFRIVENEIDGNTDTDGIDVINISLGIDFPSGAFIAQDGSNVNDGVRVPQNFKYVDWEAISVLFDPPLYLDTRFNIRSLFE
jgi:3-phytase